MIISFILKIKLISIRQPNKYFKNEKKRLKLKISLCFILNNKDYLNEKLRRRVKYYNKHTLTNRSKTLLK